MKDKPYILIVDDDPNIGHLVQLYLEQAGYDVKVALRGDDALSEFRKLPPDLMILDLMLPGVDGWQVLKTVRKSSAIPVIMLTAKDETFDKVLGLELGADDYITKPFDAKELVARVKAVLRRTRRSARPTRRFRWSASSAPASQTSQSSTSARTPTPLAALNTPPTGPAWCAERSRPASAAE